MRVKIGVAAIAVAIVLTGCTSVPDLSRLHNDMEAEYIAGALLKHDAGYDGMLEYDRSVLNATPTPAVTPSPVASAVTQGEENTPSVVSSPGGIAVEQTYTSIDTVLPVKGIQLTQETYEVRQSYGSDFAAVDAEKGNKLLIIKFRIKNTTPSRKKVELNSLSYSLELNGEPVGRCLQLIMGDIQNFSERIPARRSRESVLIFEVPKEQKIEKGRLYVTDGTQTAQMSLK